MACDREMRRVAWPFGPPASLMNPANRNGTIGHSHAVGCSPGPNGELKPRPWAMLIAISPTSEARNGWVFENLGDVAIKWVSHPTRTIVAVDSTTRTGPRQAVWNQLIAFCHGFGSVRSVHRSRHCQTW